MDHWDYAHCLPYFKRMETCLAGPDEWRGGEGPLELERGPAVNPLFQAWLKAGEQAGFRRTDDVNGFGQEGLAVFDKNVRRCGRLSAARAYLHPVMDRPNLMYHFLPVAVRYDESAPPKATATRCTSAPCSRTRRAR